MESIGHEYISNVEFQFPFLPLVSNLYIHLSAFLPSLALSSFRYVHRTNFYHSLDLKELKAER
jgi:hypothetical protein